MAAVVQGKRSNFDCDLFQEIIQYAAGLAGVSYSYSAPDTNDVDTALRVIARPQPRRSLSYCRGRAALQ